MENFLFDENTVAVEKNNNQTIIYSVDNFKVINKKTITIIKNNCLINGSTLLGRKESIKKIIDIKYKIPILITNNIILLQLNSLRSNNSLFIVLNKIIDYKQYSNYLEIKCVNNIFNYRISKKSFERLLINGIKLNNYLSLKNKNIV